MADPSPLITGVEFVCIPAQDFDAITAFYGGTFSSNAMPSLHRRYAPKDERPASAAHPPPANPEDSSPR